MGWLFYAGSKRELIQDRIREETALNGRTIRTLAHCLRGNCLWSVKEISMPPAANVPPVRVICLDLLGAHDGRWGYKDMTEADYPYYFTCPESYLDMVTPENGGDFIEEEWREQVRAASAARKARPKLVVGKKYRLSNGYVGELLSKDRGKLIFRTLSESTVLGYYPTARAPRSMVVEVL